MEQIAKESEALTNSVDANTAAATMSTQSLTSAVFQASQAIIAEMRQETNAANIREAQKRTISQPAATVAQNIANYNTAKAGLKVAAKASANRIALGAAQYCLTPIPAATKAACYAKLNADLIKGGFVPNTSTGDNSDHSFSFFSKAYASTNTDFQAIGCHFAGPVEFNDPTKPVVANSLAQAQGQACYFSMLMKSVAMYNPLDQAQSDPNKNSNAAINFQSAASKSVEAVIGDATKLANNMTSPSASDSTLSAQQTAAQQVVQMGQTAGVTTDAQNQAGTISVADADGAVAAAQRGEGGTTLLTQLAGANAVNGEDVMGHLLQSSATQPTGDTTIIAGGGDMSGGSSGSGTETGELYVPPKTLVSGLSLRDIFGAAPPETTLLSQNSP